jgi:uncharacterized membrane protein
MTGHPHTLAGSARPVLAEVPASAHRESLGLERIILFSDAVFAIVITLLVLPLTAEIELPEGGRDLAAHVWSQWPKVLSFLVSFLVIGQFWIAHHRMFEHVRRYDQGLLWFNLVSLLTVSFLPFPTALIGARLESDDAFPVVFYAASMTVSSIALTTTWFYAVRRKLIGAAVPVSQVRTFSARALATSVIFLLSIGAALLGLPVAVLCWLLLLPVARALLVHATVPRQLMSGEPRQPSDGLIHTSNSLALDNKGEEMSVPNTDVRRQHRADWLEQHD